MRLLLDEMIGPRVLEQLGGAPGDVVAVAADPSLRALPDPVLLELATEQGRVLVTRNIGDFARLHQQWQSAGRQHAGLVMVPERAFPQGRNLVGALVAALLAAEQGQRLPAPGEVLYLRPAAADRA